MQIFVKTLSPLPPPPPPPPPERLAGTITDNKGALAAVGVVGLLVALAVWRSRA